MNRNSSEDQTVGGTLKAIIRNIPAFEIEGEATFNMTEEEWQFASELEIDYWGDQLIELPSTLRDAIRVYKNLTAHTIASTKVVEYSLSPITDYCDKVTSILNEISDDNIDSVSKISKARNLFYQVLLHMVQPGLVQYRPSMMSQGKTPGKDPGGVFPASEGSFQVKVA